MLELLTKQKAKNKQIVIPRIDNCIYEFPLIDSLQPTINRTGVDPIIVGITKTEDGYHFKNLDGIELDHKDMIQNEYTISGWINILGTPSFSKFQTMFGGIDFELSVTPDYAIRIGTRVNGFRQVGNLGIGGVSKDSWCHLAVSYRNGVGLFGFINGENIGVIPTNVGYRIRNTPVMVGEYGNNRAASNAIYRGMHVYNVALSPVEVHELYRNSFDIKR